MTEPPKVYRSGCQEVPSYGDTTFSRHFTYEMNSLTKGHKLRSLLRILIYILGFLIIAFSFTIIGIVIYPKLVRHCKKQISPENRQQANQINGHYLPSLGEILSGMGLCKEPYNDTFAERVYINKTETESSLKNVNANYLNNNECKCFNSSMKLNISESDTEHHTSDKCICNETKEYGDFQRNNIGNESKINSIKLLNGHDATPPHHIYINETDTVEGIPYSPLNPCDCTNVRKLGNHSSNGNDSEIYYASFKEDSQCNCSETIGSNIDVYNTASAREEHEKNSQGFGKCHCFNGNLNVSEFDREKMDGTLTEVNECICPETLEIPAFNENESTNGSMENVMQSLLAEEVHEIPDFHFNETDFVNKSREQDLESLIAGETNGKADLYFNKTEIPNENQSLMKAKCTCPKTRNMTYVLFNGTKLSDEIHDFNFEEDAVCECPPLHDNDNFYNETETNYNTSLNAEECVCSEITDTLNNESAIKGNMSGFKSMNGECICPETLGLHNFSDTGETNGNGKYDAELFTLTETVQTINLPLNETEIINEKHSPKSNKCICPRPYDVFANVSNDTPDGFHDFDFKRDDGCICPNTEVERKNNFDRHEAETESHKNDNEPLKSYECLCHNNPESINNASSIGNTKIGFKTLNGDCVCPELLDVSDIHDNVKQNIKKEEFTLDDETDSANVKELRNGQEIESAHKNESNIGYKISTISDNGLKNGNERNNENKKELSYNDEKGSSDTSLGFEGVTSAYDKFNQYEKEIRFAEEKEILSGQHMSRDDEDY